MFQFNRSRPANHSHPQTTRRLAQLPLRTDLAVRSESGVWIGTRARARMGLLALLVACAATPPTAGAADTARTGLQPQGPGAVFDSVEAAAIDALSYAHLEAGLRERRSLRVGVIHRVPNGYSYTAAKRATASSPLVAPSVRYRLRAIDVARYVIPPRSRKTRINRSNEEPTRNEMQIVDELDPAHRPIYKLAPSLNVVSYRHGGRASVLVNLGDLASRKTAPDRGDRAAQETAPDRGNLASRKTAPDSGDRAPQETAPDRGNLASQKTAPGAS